MNKVYAIPKIRNSLTIYTKKWKYYSVRTNIPEISPSSPTYTHGAIPMYRVYILYICVCEYEFNIFYIE